jgi:tetratricopeptide (TPR) repeat protein
LLSEIRIRIFSLLLPALLVAGCAQDTLLQKQDTVESRQDTPIENEIADTASTSIDEETLLVFLTGEIAAQRGQLDFAFDNYLQAALSSRDAYAARRATRIALFRKNNAAALKSARLWVDIAPDSLQARNTYAVMLFRDGDSAGALENLLLMHGLAEKEGKDAFMIAALSLSKEKNQAAAENLLRAMAAAHADDARGFTALGVLQSAFKNYEGALKSLEQSSALDPDQVQSRLLTVRILVEQKKNRQAIDYLEAILGRFSDNFEMRMIYAKLLVSTDHKAAYREFQQLHAIKPDDGDVIVALGVLAVQIEDLRAAKNWWQMLLEKGDRDQRSNAAFQLGQLAELAGNNDEAAGYYDQVNHGEYRIDARIRLARLEAGRGDVSRARDIFKQLRVLNPEHVSDYYVAEAQLLRDHVAVADVMAFFDEALLSRPDDLDLIYARGLYAADQNLVEQAESDFRAVLSKQPDNADAMNALGYTLADQTDRYQEAFELIKRAYDQKPENAAVLDSMGWVNYRMGNFELALSYLQKAAAKVNDDEIAAHLGEVLWVMGKTGEARDVWQRAIKDFPGSTKLTEVMRRLDN